MDAEVIIYVCVALVVSLLSDLGLAQFLDVLVCENCKRFNNLAVWVARSQHVIKETTPVTYPFLESSNVLFGLEWRH